MLQPVIKKNDKLANRLIIAVSAIVFLAVTALANVKWSVQLPFSPHIFATINAIINGTVAVMLVLGIIAIKDKKPVLHKNIMLVAIVLSVLFLLSYIAHHLLTDATKYGDVNHDNLISPEEKSAAGFSRTIYYFLLLTHIPLAGIILPFILYTAYRALTGEYAKHKKLAKLTWPVWLYVAISGVVIYLMIAPYYNS